MNKNIFSYNDYKKYINDYILAQPKHGHGLKLKMADTMRCKVAFVSQVLKGEHHFSLEHATLLSEYLGHSEEESHFFLLLVQEARSGSAKVKKYFQKQIDDLIERRTQMKNRFHTPQPLAEMEQSRYYSSWYYAAVHILITIPEFRTKEAIASRLHIDIQQLNKILDFLLSCGLIVQDGNEYMVGTNRIYLGNDSPLTAKVHQNWRLKTIESLERENKQELHYSSVVSLSSSDVKRIRERLMKELEVSRGIIRESKEEKLYAICLDWFEV